MTAAITDGEDGVILLCVGPRRGVLVVAEALEGAVAAAAVLRHHGDLGGAHLPKNETHLGNEMTQ